MHLTKEDTWLLGIKAQIQMNNLWHWLFDGEESYIPLYVGVSRCSRQMKSKIPWLKHGKVSL